MLEIPFQLRILQVWRGILFDRNRGAYRYQTRFLFGPLWYLAFNIVLSEEKNLIQNLALLQVFHYNSSTYSICFRRGTSPVALHR